MFQFGASDQASSPPSPSTIEVFIVHIGKVAGWPSCLGRLPGRYLAPEFSRQAIFRLHPFSPNPHHYWNSRHEPTRTPACFSAAETDASPYVVPETAMRSCCIPEVRCGWVVPEANPTVAMYCEHPGLGSDHHGLSADFCVLREGRPQWPALSERSEPVPAEDASASTSNFIQFISTAGLDQYRGWIQNWMSLLPSLNAVKRLIEAALANDVIGFLRTRSFDRSI